MSRLTNKCSERENHKVHAPHRHAILGVGVCAHQHRWPAADVGR